MTREELIKQCRYYRGYDDDERASRPGEYNGFWSCERYWVNCNGKVDEYLAHEYEKIGGKKYLEIPYGLLLIIFSSWGKYVYKMTKEKLPDFYDHIDLYLELAKVQDEMPMKVGHWTFTYLRGPISLTS